MLGDAFGEYRARQQRREEAMERVGTEGSIRPPSELSLDARALHDQLPDIDFLRASMIMFP
ncbi:hypothetical protein KIN20_009093 [Parelaphostrongylus tenuis]|uniref:Uncharacterized protein n=1 Tax=Parelaphostrongylus tenuis TaxID=148309 RepID=A0AAD5QN45_PARTN|nr:hypothetical protein KIN20_009093 [Parelaphostrongylus tenuis]